jgi:acetoin utilization deacetylase AcuC-like enzyme
MATGFLCDSFFTLHDTGEHPETAGRITAIQEGVAAAGLLPKLAMIGQREAVEAEITLVHSVDYFRMVQEDVRAGAGQLSTGDTVISARSLEVALRATGGVVNAVDAVVEGRMENAFCAVRPPGHHATPTRGMGFCIFNNIAIAARYAQKKHGVGKILIVDWDVHHGNGTQDAFYEDDSVLFFSSHQHPWYPGTGMREETGHGRGLGYTVNAPLPAGSGLAEIVNAMEGRLEAKVRQFRPELVLISAGFDSRVDDPLGQFVLRDADFAALTVRVMGWAREFAGGRIVSILEGGYNLETLGGAVAAHVRALME